ncbi:hypothetical protein MVEN_00254500 [Mycena venus]|uniref:Uncharacterized protein n=1 Tax=Mycena venus TaxID=2733690 RepID=A0A8H7DEJ8_9AGAR|nr:hypothetical protein MVEN_00254500 [Mycena venus]
MTDDSPAFPPELERRIFESAAEIHPQMAPTLLRVAHRVLIWLEPLVYKTLAFTGWPSPNVPPALVRTVQSKPPGFFQRSVHNFIFWNDSDAAIHQPLNPIDLYAVLSKCTGIQNLALWDLVPSMISMLWDLQPRRLTIPTFPLSYPQVLRTSTSIFTHITHLLLTNRHLVIPEADDIPKISSILCAIPTLTHLCVSALVDRIGLCRILDDCKALKLLLSLHSDDPGPRDVAESAPDPEITDPRFAIVVMNYAQYFQDWKIGAAGRRDFWVRAEEFVVKKRKGQTQNLAFWYEDDD